MGGSRGQEIETSLASFQDGETMSLLKMPKKISQAQWQAPVIPATQPAEAKELLETRRPRWADCLSLGVQDHPGQHGETPNSTKNTIN